MACNLQKFVGRDVVMEYVIGCGDEVPLEQDWKRFGSMRTKEFTLEWETTDTTADDSIGALRENLATFQTLSVSGDGTVKASGDGAAHLIELTKHVADPSATSGQPFAWVRMTFLDLTFTAFMIITKMSRSASYADVVTYSFEANARASDFGLMIEDTRSGQEPTEVESVTVLPATLTLDVDDTYALAYVILPTNAPGGVTWVSSDPGVATVHPNTGLVTAVGTGTATITATSASEPSVTADCVVTVS